MKIKKWAAPNEQMCIIGRHQWSLPRLLELARDLPVMEIPIDHLNVYQIYEKLTLRDMVMHMNAAIGADLNYPIILDEDGEILDGRHRIMKAMLNEIPVIKAVRFEENPSPCRVVDE